MSLEESKFCTKCGLKLPKPSMFAGFTKSPQPYEFQDGWYCEKCAITKVSAARGKK